MGWASHLYISSDSSRSRSCFSWMSRNQSTMSASSESSVERSQTGETHTGSPGSEWLRPGLGRGLARPWLLGGL